MQTGEQTVAISDCRPVARNERQITAWLRKPASSAPEAQFKRLRSRC